MLRRDRSGGRGEKSFSGPVILSASTLFVSVVPPSPGFRGELVAEVAAIVLRFVNDLLVGDKLCDLDLGAVGVEQLADGRER